MAFLFGSASAIAQSAPPQAGPTLLAKVEVTASSDQAQLNAIDRKVYSVGKDLQAVAGSAADVLQNIPSVQVDVDGNVSLRGDPGVQILIDGHTSGLMGTASRADVLSQLPADSIDRIEVITTPSARYKPDGTAGIINIVLKKKHPAGLSGNIRLTVGNAKRYGTALSAGFSLGKFSFSGLLNYRQDDRIRIYTDNRSYIDPATGVPATTQTHTREHVRPEFKLANLEAKFQASSFDSLRETLDYTDRGLHRFSNEQEDSDVGGTDGLYNRLRDDPENERDAESTTSYDHEFGRSDNTLSAEFRWEHYTEIENNHYTDIFSAPPGPPELDTTKIFTNEPSTEASLEYSNALSDKTTFEAGFDRSEDISRQNHEGAVFDPAAGQWENDPTVTNDFDLDQVVTALYGTYRHAFGHLGAMFGLRVESATVETEQVTSAIHADQRYLRIYPTLHLKYDLSDTQQLQFNYSHRVHRPENDDLNPFPEYQDPDNLRAGNPYLRPEESHSFEAGYQYKEDETTYLATLYYKYSYNGFTTISQFLNSTTLLTTEENLSKSQSGGLELAATAKPAAKLSVNASANIFYNEIDASNLGYSTNLSTFAWAGKLSAQYALSDRSILQFNCNYTAKRLTPQGYRLPTFVANIGIRHELKNRRVTLVLTVSDLLNSLKDETRLDTPTLKDDAMRRRNSRILYAGIVYSFGGSKKKKDDTLQFDDNP